MNLDAENTLNHRQQKTMYNTPKLGLYFNIIGGHLRARNSASSRCKGYKEHLTGAFRPEGHH
jgi:hypothetical protein